VLTSAPTTVYGNAIPITSEVLTTCGVPNESVTITERAPESG
jgi:hypothetical protein